MKTVKIVGAGLAGSEAAWQIAHAGFPVEIMEMRPLVMTKAHKTGLCAELVCSNSFRGVDFSNAVGLLKLELQKWGSLVMEAALHSQVPAGGALAVDRVVFSNYIDHKIRTHPHIRFRNEEVFEIPDASPEMPVVVATGPLTSNRLAASIEALTGYGSLAFFDAISPIVLDESIDHSCCFRQSRYDKGGNDYLNIPLSREQYYAFVEDIQHAEKYKGNEEVESDCIENLRPFEGCMPIEDMVLRGVDTMLFGPLKPVGLTNPKTGARPFAVVQLRQDDKNGKLWSMVGMQTRMKRGEQERIFRKLPGLAKAEFVRFGSVHRNTFIDSPKCLNATLEFRRKPGLFFAGQITGTEGYVESTAGGLVAGINALRLLRGKPPLVFPPETAVGALLAYISEPSREDFQPMNISYGLMPTYIRQPKRDERGRKVLRLARRKKACDEALSLVDTLIAETST